MADFKKKESPKSPDFPIRLAGILGVLFFLGLMLTQLNTYFGQDFWSFVWRLFQENIWPVIKIIGFIISLLCLYGIFHNFKKLSALAKEEIEMYAPKAMSPEGVVENAKNERWERVLGQINSANSSDWRLAIIEADIMLDELLSAMGYHGDSVGEKLKGVEPSDFRTLDAAWEAHKVRNDIAHRSATFELTERDAKRIVSLYEAVFREFNII